MKTNDYKFKKATPVWERGTQLTMNRTVAFVAIVNGKNTDCTLAVSGASSFTVFINGEFIAHGPARTAHGFYRVDEYMLRDRLNRDENTVEIRVSGYNVNSFAYLDQPSFICAEIVAKEDVIAATGIPCLNFTAYGVDEKIMKVHRFSYQRPFTENYRLGDGAFDYCAREALDLEACPDKHFICRDLPYGEYERLSPVSIMGRGKVSYSEKDKYFTDRAITIVSDSFKGYKEDELEFKSYVEVGKMNFTMREDRTEPADSFTIQNNTYVDLDMGANETGLVYLEIDAQEDCELYVTSDEVLMPDGEVNCFRFDVTSVISLILKKGSYTFVSAEPYVMKYLRLVAKGADVTVHKLNLIEVAFPKSLIKTQFVSDDAVMKKIYDAALRTFRANVVDFYMDCPSRERAGWLCDSFFTSRVEKILTGASVVERQHLANFILPGQLPLLPDGMLPMCYPADILHNTYIPNWAMWYVVELAEYLDRTGDRELIDGARERVYALAKYFEGFENELGLLEKLKGWIFVEWSKCNSLVQDVSFPSNMMYAKMLRSIAYLYGDESLEKKAQKIKDTVNSIAMTESGFYCDNAVRGEDGKLHLSGERTETCQYYAFFCDFATPETHRELWERLIFEFGYDREKTGKYPDIYFAAPFIGNYLRLDLLHRYGYHDKLYGDIRGYFEYMADRTGTLWEHASVHASCNHGFASHVIYWMKTLGLVQ